MKILSFFAATIALFEISGSIAHGEIIESFGSGSNQFSLTFVTIGNPGNAPQTTGNPSPVGSVGYSYRMGKYEVSRDMIDKANSEGGLELAMLNMTGFGGNGPNRPATGISWNQAARFVNWLNVSKGYAPAYKFAVQPGDVGYSANAFSNIQVWTVSDAGYNPANAFRNNLARYFLPSMDEWFKAAYYDPNANGGVGSYWRLPTGSNSAPVPVAGGTAEGTAVYNQPSSQGPADIDNAGGLSPYGIMGMGGNVWEWQETSRDLTNSSGSLNRGLRGGAWDNNNFGALQDWNLFGYPPISRVSNWGFRVASIPEPSSGTLLVLAMVGLWQRRRQF